VGAPQGTHRGVSNPTEITDHDGELQLVWHRLTLRLGDQAGVNTNAVGPLLVQASRHLVDCLGGSPDKDDRSSHSGSGHWAGQKCAARRAVIEGRVPRVAVMKTARGLTVGKGSGSTSMYNCATYARVGLPSMTRSMTRTRSEESAET